MAKERMSPLQWKVLSVLMAYDGWGLSMMAYKRLRDAAYPIYCKVCEGDIVPAKFSVSFSRVIRLLLRKGFIRVNSMALPYAERKFGLTKKGARKYEIDCDLF